MYVQSKASDAGVKANDMFVFAMSFFGLLLCHSQSGILIYH